MDQQIQKLDNWIDETSSVFVDVAVQCSDTAGTIKSAMNAAEELGKRHLELETISEQLSVEIKKLTRATSEARELSDEARSQVDAGAVAIDSSMAGFADTIALIHRLGAHISGVASAMDQVKKASQAIDAIARTTNMLALNAAIEAQKAGDAGKTFAVVAAEVKNLAMNSRAAAVEITGTVNSLSAEAEKLATEIGNGIDQSAAAQSQFSNLGQLLNGISEIVSRVDERHNAIALNTVAIDTGIEESRRLRTVFDHANAALQFNLDGAQGEITLLESRANTMFDQLVRSGLSRQDTIFVELAQEAAKRFVEVTEKSLASGELSADQLFDNVLVPIEGSNPPRFQNRMTDWANLHWRPLLDWVGQQRSEILTVVCSDMQGYLPTHMTQFSRAPINDFAHDNRYCRNGRIFFDETDKVAKKSEKPFIMCVYRHSGMVETERKKMEKVVRNVCVPLRFNGRRWGDIEIAYIL